jgi:phage-related minor tail protein
MKHESWLERNLPMVAVTGGSLLALATMVGTAIVMSKMSDQIDELNERLDNNTGWLLEEVIAVGQDVKDIRDELDQ